MPHELILKDLCLMRGKAPLLRLSAHIRAGDVLTVMGPSGVGKSTLLDFVMGDLPAAFSATGRVILDGQDLNGLRPEARKIGILYQDPLLFPHLSVAQNLAFGLPKGYDRASEITRALSAIGMEGFGARDPATLSGGQAARIALMRTLLARPCALLLDEPFSKLDAQRRDQMRRLVFDEARAKGIPVLMVTHDAQDAAAAGGRVIELGLPQAEA